MSFRIGIAGWSIPSVHKDEFSVEGTHLQRYAQTFNAVEINSSFYREHKAMTYQRWAESVPDDFRFSVKLNKVFTHGQKLDIQKSGFVDSLNDIRELGSKWGALLVQIPPSLQFEATTAMRFFKMLRKNYAGPVVFEPRHKTWMKAVTLFEDFNISKVQADPEPCSIPEAEARSSTPYRRWHGSPKIYYSEYGFDFLKSTALQMQNDEKCGLETWCIFDNTALFHATTNALQLKKILNEESKRKPADQEFSL